MDVGSNCDCKRHLTDIEVNFRPMPPLLFGALHGPHCHDFTGLAKFTL